MATKRTNILITGANGQIGTVLTSELKNIYGGDKIITSDIRPPQNEDEYVTFINLDVLDREALYDTVEKYNIGQVYHLAAILSAKGEQMPLKAWDVNINSLFNVLEAARHYELKVFFPSSIAVFSRHTPPKNTPQHTVMEPETVYGISKVAGESWCQYYYEKYGVDVRSVRYPGIIGYNSEPGGGTTDYAVGIFHKAIQEEPFECYLSADTRLPMMYMPDAIRATIELMQAEAEKLTIRTSYNISGMSFSPDEIKSAIQKHVTDFEVKYNPDYRQKIAESWPESIDDSIARQDWQWKPEYGLDDMSHDMLDHLREQLNSADISR